jgi:hypothetical protein
LHADGTAALLHHVHAATASHAVCVVYTPLHGSAAEDAPYDSALTRTAIDDFMDARSR